MRNGEALLVPIELDRTRRLRFDMNALAVLEEHGLNVFDEETLSDLDKVIRSPSKIRLFVWAGLLHEDPELTLQEAGALIAGDSFLPAMNAVAAALDQAMPKAPADAEGNAPAAAPARRRPGKNSGP